MRRFFSYLILFAFTLVFYLPILVNPKNLFERGNDLEEVFWPVFYFIRNKFWETHTLPLWNNLFFSGTPLLPDPQFSLFYPPNWLFILLPTDPAFFVWLVTHTFFAGVFFWLLSRQVFGFSRLTSFVLACLYVASPRLGGYLAAGHYGLVGSLTWLPLVTLACFKIVSGRACAWSILLGLSFAALFYLHTVTLLLALSFSAVLLLTLVFIKKGDFKRTFLCFVLSAFVSVGLTAVTLLPQLEWLPQTTRFLLLQDRDVYPKWSSIFEFVTSTISPFLSSDIHPQDTEKWLFLGIIPIILALVGFFKLKRVHQILIAAALLLVTLISLNNASPVYNLLLSQDWYVLLRVATRIWFVPVFIVLILSGVALEHLRKKHSLFLLLTILALLESVYISWLAINKPVQTDKDHFAPKEVYEFLAKDKELFRVFCTTRCLSQKESTIHGLELVEGYNTVQQTNYFKHMWQLTGKYWGYYTLALPPLGSYLFEEIQPQAIYLGEFNTKYVISLHHLKDTNFKEISQFGGYKIYQNLLSKPRANSLNEDGSYQKSLDIVKYTPNEIVVNTSNTNTNKIVLAEVYSPGWKAYLDGGKEIAVLERPNALRQVDLRPNTEYVTFLYQPNSHLIGKIISLSTLFLLFLFSIINPLHRDKGEIERKI